MTRQVLLIDDYDLFRSSVAELFRHSDYELVEASSPQEGISLLDENPDIQIILLDLSFDEEAEGKETPGGLRVLDHIADRAENYRVIVLTGHDEMLLAEQAGAYKIFNYLPKADRSSAQAIRFSVDQAFKDLQHENLARKVDFILRAQDRINEDGETKITLDLICQSVREIVGAYTCHIRVYDFQRGDFHLQGFAGPQEKVREAFTRPKEKGNLFSGRVVTSRQPEAFDDLQGRPDFCEFKNEALARGVSSEESRYFETVASAYIVPISTGLYGDLVDGVLNVSSDRKAYFTEEKQALVNEFVSQAALAVTKDWLQKKRREAQKDNADISTMLGAMSDVTKGTESLQSIYDVVTLRISEIVNPEIVSIFRYNEVTGLLVNVAEARGEEIIRCPAEEYTSGQSLTGHVFQDREVIHLPLPDDPDSITPTKDPRYDSGNEVEHLNQIPSGELKHYLAVPIRVGGKVRGVLRVLNKKSQYYDSVHGDGNRRCLLERGFSDDCRHVLEITARHLAVAIRNVELIQQVRTLGAVGRLINSALNIDELLKVTITKMSEVMQAEICMLFLKDEEEERVVLKQVFGIPETLIPNAFYKLGQGVTGEVARSREPRLLGTALENKGKYDRQIRSHLTATRGKPTKITSLMAVPILARDQLLGVMKVINKVGDHLEYDELDLELFQTFADYVGVAIENAQIYKHATDRLAIAERNTALSLLVSAVAHEINNTSGVIPANVENIRAHLRTPNEDIKRMLDVIEDAASQSVDFANELAGFSATRAGRQRALNINEVIDDATKALVFERYWDPKKAVLELSLADEPLVCDIFRTPFIQIVRNVVINAIQALEGKQGGRVRVSTQKGTGGFSGSAVVRFEDNGPGIKPEYRSRIFEPDFTTKPKGNGIGLWLVRMQLQTVNGTIELDTEPTQGAAFIVRIPMAPSDTGALS